MSQSALAQFRSDVQKQGATLSDNEKALAAQKRAYEKQTAELIEARQHLEKERQKVKTNRAELDRCGLDPDGYFGSGLLWNSRGTRSAALSLILAELSSICFRGFFFFL